MNFTFNIDRLFFSSISKTPPLKSVSKFCSNKCRIAEIKMPMHFGCFDKCKKKVCQRKRETERMITMITSTGHHLFFSFLFFFLRDSYHSLCLCQVYKEKIQQRFNQALRPEQKANESCSLSCRAAPVTSSLHTANEASIRGFQLTSPLTASVGFLCTIIKK